jgi:hypothetical protein
MRLAIVAFLLRLSQIREASDFNHNYDSRSNMKHIGLYKILLYAVGVLILVQTISGFLFRLLECKNIQLVINTVRQSLVAQLTYIFRDLWKPPGTGVCIAKESEAIMMWTHAGFGIFVDFSLLLLPVWVIHSQMIFSAKTIRVILIFCVGLFVIITGIVRLAIMAQTDFSTDT